MKSYTYIFLGVKLGIYGRNDYDGTTPGSITNLNAGTISSAIYKYGGHTGVDPIAGTGSTFHYHLTEWKGCYDESNGTKYADDGETTDTVTGSAGTCSLGSSAAWVDTWFLTGHGNGGVYMSVPTTSASTTPDSDTAGIRYYYGTAGSCTGC